jgi:hypothetical protein
MKYLIYCVPFLAGCSFLESVVEEAEIVGEVAGPVVAEKGPEIVEKIGEAAGGDPVAIVGAAGAVAAAITAIVVRHIRKKKAAK